MDGSNGEQLEDAIFNTETFLGIADVLSEAKVSSLSEIPGAFVVTIRSVSNVKKVCRVVRRQVGYFPWRGRRRAALSEIVDELLEGEVAASRIPSNVTLLIFHFEDEAVLQLSIPDPDVTLRQAMLEVILDRESLYANASPGRRRLALVEG